MKKLITTILMALAITTCVTSPTTSYVQQVEIRKLGLVTEIRVDDSQVFYIYAVDGTYKQMYRR